MNKTDRLEIRISSKEKNHFYAKCKLNGEIPAKVIRRYIKIYSTIRVKK